MSGLGRLERVSLGVGGGTAQGSQEAPPSPSPRRSRKEEEKEEEEEERTFSCWGRPGPFWWTILVPRGLSRGQRKKKLFPQDPLRAAVQGEGCVGPQMTFVHVQRHFRSSQHGEGCAVDLWWSEASKAAGRPSRPRRPHGRERPHPAGGGGEARTAPRGICHRRRQSGATGRRHRATERSTSLRPRHPTCLRSSLEQGRRTPTHRVTSSHCPPLGEGGERERAHPPCWWLRAQGGPKAEGRAGAARRPNTT